MKRSTVYSAVQGGIFFSNEAAAKEYYSREVKQQDLFIYSSYEEFMNNYSLDSLQLAIKEDLMPNYKGPNHDIDDYFKLEMHNGPIFVAKADAGSHADYSVSAGYYESVEAAERASKLATTWHDGYAQKMKIYDSVKELKDDLSKDSGK